MEKVFSGKPERTRPNSRLQPQNLLETTPVLFRLPMVHLQVFPTAGAEYGNDRVTDHQPSNSFARSSAVGSQLAAEKASLPVPNKVAEVLTPAVEDHPSASYEGTKTWWEHWSSGIVIVLLVIAMVVLGIIALRSNGQPSGPLATDALTSEFGDLESITVPTPEIAESSTKSLPNSIEALEGDQQSLETHDSLVNELANTDVAPFESQITESPVAALTTAAPAMATQTSLPEGMQLPEIGNSSKQLATATLLLPTPHDGPQQEYSQVSKMTNPEGLPDAEVPGESHGTSQASIPAQPAASQLGQSPSLYDEAKGHSQPIVPAQPSFPAQPEFQRQLVQEQFGGGMPNIAGNKTASNPVTTQVSVAMPGLGGQQSQSAMRSTATPDSDEEEIIRAYLELSQGSQQSADSTSSNSNRYQRSSGN